MNIIKPSSPMKSKPSEVSLLETECLFGETIEILDENLKWVYCRLLTDNYYGWIKKEDVGNFQTSTHRVISNRSFIFKEQSVKSSYIDYLPLGSQLTVTSIEGDWAQINLSNNNKAYVPRKHIITISNKINNWVEIAEQLVGTPYKWGGRDSIGLDCSALLQLSYQAYGKNIPRNTIDQIKLNKETVTDINSLNRGFVIFWEGHVGIMTDKSNCIHANEFHMKTTIEPLVDIIIRMDKKNQIIKIMNFN